MTNPAIAVPRELLERSAQMIQFYVEYLCATNSEESDIELAGECADQLRALLTAQPQAGAAIPFAGYDPRFCPGSNPDNPQTEEEEPEQASAAQSAPAGAVPEGYRWYLVPKEDTDAFNAACSAANDAYFGGVGPCGAFIAGYRAMLAAAPAQPAAQDQGEVQRLREALKLSANRLDRLTLEVPGGYWREQAAEWASEARAAIAASTGKEVKP